MKAFGVDPGLAGAIALLDDGKLVKVWDVPTFTVVSRKKGKDVKRREIDIRGLCDIFDSDMDCKRGFLERVQPMRQRPGQEDKGFAQQGLVSTGRLMEGYGIIRGVMGACGISVTRVMPAVWKRKLGLIGQPKSASRMRASELFPEYSGFWRSDIKSGRAEAALIGFWGAHHGPESRDDAEPFDE